jgi:hypothetical protein
LRALKGSSHLTTFGNTWAISSLSLKALLDGSMQLRVVVLFVIQANWLMPIAVAHMTMHNAYPFGQASDGL